MKLIIYCYFLLFGFFIGIFCTKFNLVDFFHKVFDFSKIPNKVYKKFFLIISFN